MKKEKECREKKEGRNVLASEHNKIGQP